MSTYFPARTKSSIGFASPAADRGAGNTAAPAVPIMAQPQETGSPLGVLFVDISDSTRLYRRLGDERAADAILQFLAKLSVVVEGHGGRVVDRIGDELMCVFESVSQTVEAAVDLHWAASAFAMDRPDLDDVTVRIGLHFGPVIEESGRIFGETVYTAKRMVSQAKPQQIILTGATAVQLGDSSPFALRFVDNALLKGHRTASELHEVIWNL